MEGMRNNRVNKNQSNKRKRLEGNNLKMKTYVEENNKRKKMSELKNMREQFTRVKELQGEKERKIAISKHKLFI